jgi:FkbM family methyltransferase
MSKYLHAIQNGLASLTGWFRLHSTQPKFAREIFKHRWRYFVRREFTPGLVTPDGFVLKTPDTLITYWSMFVERELHSDEWIAPLQAAERPLVIDVGANAGMFSHMAFYLNPRVEIIAFEPLPMMADSVNALMQRNNMNLRCIPKAVGREIGTATLESPHGYDGTSRICVSGQTTGQAIQVEVTTLDQELKGRPVLVMKIDVEGFEEEVIAGGTETLSRTKFLIIEAHNTVRRDHLTSLLGPGWTRKKLGSSDYLFSRSADA